LLELEAQVAHLVATLRAVAVQRVGLAQQELNL
jgi:hypothetical protein